MKWCKKCEQWKEWSEFYNHKRMKDGKHSQCKECVKWYKKQWEENNKNYKKKYNKQYYENNKEIRVEKTKEWYENNKNHVLQQKKQYCEINKEHVRQRRKQYYKNNKEYLDQKNKQYKELPLLYDSSLRQEIELYEEIKESENSNVECRCAYCGKWFEPSKSQIYNRINCINGKQGNGGSESRLYCSDECKENCPIYKQVLHSKDQKPATSREVQAQLRQIVFERDNYTCQKCETHKDDLDVGIHCHHIIPINEDPHGSADKVNCITLCEDCHKKVHQKPGCEYNELKCNS